MIVTRDWSQCIAVRSSISKVTLFLSQNINIIKNIGEKSASNLFETLIKLNFHFKEISFS